jgi:hypothetical protein
MLGFQGKEVLSFYSFYGGNISSNIAAPPWNFEFGNRIWNLNALLKGFCTLIMFVRGAAFHHLKCPQASESC